MADEFIIRLEGGPLHGAELSGRDCKPTGPIEVSEAFGGGRYERQEDDGAYVYVAQAREE